MAGIRRSAKSKIWLVYFRWDGRKCEFSTDLEDEDRARARAQDVEGFRKAILRKSMPIPGNVVDVPRFIVSGGREGFQQVAVREAIGTVDELVTQYLEGRKLRLGSKTKPLSHGSYQSDVYRLNAFKDFCKSKGKSNLPFALSPENLGHFKESLITSAEGPVSVRHKLRTVKALLLWAYNEAELIDTLPRNIKKYNDIPLPAPKPEFFTVDEVRTLYREASPQVKLWILLGLNCGYTQTDISGLTPDMVDWPRGIIARGRQKTGVESEHKMWPVTVKLLREQASAGPLLLTTKSGQPLVREEIKDGGPSKTDAVASTFTVLLEKTGVAKSFKCFRKTAAEAINKQYQEKPWLVELFLAHADPRMRVHYTRQHYDELHKATEWLGGHFGLESADVATP